MHLGALQQCLCPHLFLGADLVVIRCGVGSQQLLSPAVRAEELHSIKGELSQIKAQVDSLLESLERMDQRRERLSGEGCCLPRTLPSPNPAETFPSPVPSPCPLWCHGVCPLPCEHGAAALHGHTQLLLSLSPQGARRARRRGRRRAQRHRPQWERAPEARRGQEGTGTCVPSTARRRARTQRRR